MADVGGQWYVVSMLGECNWVRNVRAAQGRVIRRYVGRVPGGRPHIPVARHAPVEAFETFETIASNYPVFRVMPL